MSTKPLALDFEDYLALPRPKIPWLIKPIVPAGGAVLIHGDPKIGKSFAALQMAAALVGQTDNWLGFPTTGQAGRVVYVQLDTPESIWTERLEELKAANRLRPERGHFFLADRETLDTWPFDINNPEHAAKLVNLSNSIKPDVFFIDCLKECHKVPEEKNTELGNVINLLIAATHPAALVIVHHSKKPNYEYGPDVINDARGGNVLTGKMDTVLRFSEKGVHYAGRAIEHGSLKLARTDEYLWELDAAEDEMLSAFVRSIMTDESLKEVSVREKGRILADRAGLKEEQARSIIRRWRG